MDSLLVERADGVVTCTLNRPDKKNALNGEMWSGLIELFEAVATSPDDRVLVITGAGDGFCSGADLADGGTAEAGAGAGGALAGMRRVGQTALGLHQLAKPTIAAVNGVAAGAGCNLALGCDLIIASEDARFALPEINAGVLGGGRHLQRMIGSYKTHDGDTGSATH